MADPGETFTIRRGELAEGKSCKFVLAKDDEQLECFLINFRGEHRAYVNRCRHIPMTLDWVENQFFNEDASFLVCPTHGAFYEPGTGECVAGPACGRFLHAIPLTEQGDDLIATWPDPVPRD